MLGLPKERVFNKAIGMNIGMYGGEKFLVMVDLVTHYYQDSWIKIKNSQSDNKNGYRKMGRYIWGIQEDIK